MMRQKQRKIVVIGAGSVGTTYIYALLHTGLAGEVVLIDVDRKKVEGEIMDLSHGLSFIPPVKIRAGDYCDYEDADLIVVTAGTKQIQGQTRLDLIQRNVEIVNSICSEIKRVGSDAVVVMVTNPVDVLTYTALKNLNWPSNRVIGSGTVLDSARFRYMLSQHCGIDSRNVHAYVLGEHGDSEVAAWSMTHVAGVPIRDYCSICQRCDSKEMHEDITRNVRDSAYHIIDYKGSTYYAIGLSLVRISAAILRDEHSVLTVSSLLSGEYGIEDVCISVPCVVGKNGIERVLTALLAPEEQHALQNSADALSNILKEIKV
jgi:L-lactate dehydrogenase